MTQYLLPNEHDAALRLRYILPILEFLVGSCGLSHRQALIEFGYTEEEVDREQDADTLPRP